MVAGEAAPLSAIARVYTVLAVVHSVVVSLAVRATQVRLLLPLTVYRPILASVAPDPAVPVVEDTKLLAVKLKSGVKYAKKTEPDVAVSLPDDNKKRGRFSTRFTVVWACSEYVRIFGA